MHLQIWVSVRMPERIFQNQCAHRHPQHHARPSPVNLVLEALFPKSHCGVSSSVMLLGLGARKNTTAF